MVVIAELEHNCDAKYRKKLFLTIAHRCHYILQTTLTRVTHLTRFFNNESLTGLKNFDDLTPKCFD